MLALIHFKVVSSFQAQHDDHLLREPAPLFIMFFVSLILYESINDTSPSLATNSCMMRYVLFSARFKVFRRTSAFWKCHFTFFLLKVRLS